jgi:hypothetical protein
MAESRIPVEVELVFETMPCNAQRVAQEPGAGPHPCAYFRRWGTYHSYDYQSAGAPAKPGIVQDTEYVGRAPLVPEMLSGCRKAPILAVGINPNLPGWWPGTRNSINPLFDDYKQFAHYFRYRETAKLQIPESDYEAFGGGPRDVPPDSKLELRVPPGPQGRRTLRVELQQQKMYQAYQALLADLAALAGWPADHRLVVGEDLSYGNMIACPSAKWTIRPDPADPRLPAMTEDERGGIVGECFRGRRYFLRQLFQSLPTVLLVFSQSTANAFIGEMQGRFSAGTPHVGEPVDALLGREILLKYGDLPDGTQLDAKVIFAPHPTGNPAEWSAARGRVLGQLRAAAIAGRLRYNPATQHLARTGGACVFCTMLEIGDCDYLQEIRPLTAPPVLAGAAVPGFDVDKPLQTRLLREFLGGTRPVEEGWVASDDSVEATGKAGEA